MHAKTHCHRLSTIAALAAALAGLCSPADLMAGRSVEASGPEPYDPLLSEPGNVCAPAIAGRPALLQKLILAQHQTTAVDRVVATRASR